MGQLGTILLVNNHAAALVELEANVLEAEAFSVRPAANGDEYNVSLDLQAR
jgi:hypothetical protein